MRFVSIGLIVLPTDELVLPDETESERFRLRRAMER